MFAEAVTQLPLPISIAPPRRIALMGQKEGLFRALVHLKHFGRTHPLEVLAITPASHEEDPMPWNLSRLSDSLGFRLVVEQDDTRILELLRSFRVELLASLLWPKRIQDDVLNLCRHAINFHPSLLPRHRGSLTQFWAVFEGDERSGVTCHRMVHDFDAGNYLHQVARPLEPDETALSLNRKIGSAMEEAFQRVIGVFLREGSLPPGEPPPQHTHPYHYRRFPFKGVIQPEWPDDKVERFIRAMYFPPHLGAVWTNPATGEARPVCSWEEFVLLRDGQGTPPASSASPGASRGASPGTANFALGTSTEKSSGGLVVLRGGDVARQTLGGVRQDSARPPLGWSGLLFVVLVALAWGRGEKSIG